jgi:ElaB/YqjD/DUF883 family membrane-anchored ribosome-binding protein
MATYDPRGTGGTTGTTGTTGVGQGGRTEQEMRERATRERTGETGERVGEMAERIGERASGMAGAIGHRLERAGDYLEERRGEGFVAERLHGAGRYLQEHDVKSMARSVDAAICAHPYRGVLIGLGLGWVVGRFLSGRE